MIPARRTPWLSTRAARALRRAAARARLVKAKGLNRMAQQCKTIILVRHAESTNNVAKQTLKRTRRLERWPVGNEWQQLRSLLSFPMDTPLSSNSDAMLQWQRKAMCASAEQQWRAQVQVVLHSPLQRARRTAEGLFGGGSLELIEVSGIYEKSLAEHAGLRSLRQRTTSFTAALLERPEECIAVVGHSAFFRDLQFADGG